MDSELKPCPWCGDIPTAADAIADTNQGGKWGSIVCPGCGIVGPEVRTGYGQPVEWAGLAIDAWNTRALEQREASNEAKDAARLDWLYVNGYINQRVAPRAVQIACPDGVNGCLVYHARPLTKDEYRAAIDAAMTATLAAPGADDVR